MRTGLRRVSLSGLVTEQRPPLGLGLVVSLVTVAAATAAIYPLKQVAPVVSLSVVYLPAVLLVSADWGLRLGLVTSLLSAAAFNYFHIPPVGRFTISDSRNWVALAAFMTVAVVASGMADLARMRALEAERRRGEADLAAGMARELLAGSDTSSALATTAHRLAGALGLTSAALELGAVQADERRRALPLRDGNHVQIATLLIPSRVEPETMERLSTRVLPGLEAMIALALRRDEMQAEAVETAALRRSDDIKTALLRAVSHDLRTPLTAIVGAGHALGSPSLGEEDRTELSRGVVEEGERLARLVEKLLDLSKLQAGRAAPRRDWISIEEVALAACEGLDESGRNIRVAIDPDLPELRGDAAQLERALANLLENASRYSGGSPVSLNATRVGDRVIVSVVDQGPGIPAAERDRIFEPFYRGPRQQAPGEGRWPGSGLGLAIARGFVEAGGGTISVESLPGQGTSFVVSLPIETTASGAAVR